MHPFSTPETLRFSNVYRESSKGALGTNGLIESEQNLYILLSIDSGRFHHSHVFSTTRQFRYEAISGTILISRIYSFSYFEFFDHSIS